VTWLGGSGAGVLWCGGLNHNIGGNGVKNVKIEVKNSILGVIFHTIKRIS